MGGSRTARFGDCLWLMRRGGGGVDGGGGGGGGGGREVRRVRSVAVCNRQLE